MDHAHLDVARESLAATVGMPSWPSLCCGDILDGIFNISSLTCLDIPGVPECLGWKTHENWGASTSLSPDGTRTLVFTPYLVLDVHPLVFHR